MYRKKLVAVILCSVLAVSSLGVVTVSPALGSQSAFQMPFISNFTNKSQTGVVIDNNRHPNINTLPSGKSGKSGKSKEIIMKLPAQDEAVYTGTTKSLSSNQADNMLFRLEQRDLEEFLNEGYSMEDILKAGEAANKVFEDPKKLLKIKSEDNKEWNEIEKDVQNQRKQAYINKMKNNYPSYYSKFTSEKLSTDDMVVLFAYANHYEISSIDGLIKDYKKNGKKALDKSKTIIKQGFSKTKLNKLGLTAEDVQGISDEMLDKLEIISQKSSTPIKDLIKELKVTESVGEVKQ